MLYSKTIHFFFLLFALLFILSSATAAQFDLDFSGSFDDEDIALLRARLLESASNEDLAVMDYDLDGQLTVSDLVFLEQALSEGRTSGDSPVTVYQEFYGKSALGRDLVCTVIEPERVSRTMLVVFALHGFEGAYDRDGELLVHAAEAMIEYFQNASSLYGTRLMIVSCANPDGLAEGTTSEGFGRCNKSGIDLDRDFDAAHIPMRLGRNFTRSPFSAPESRALRDLVLQYQPDIVLDFHGWDGTCVGDLPLSSVFESEMGIAHTADFNDQMHGTFSNWAHKQGADCLRIELPGTDFDQGALIYTIERILLRDTDPSGIYAEDARFADFPDIAAYTLDKKKVTTFVDLGSQSAGYISGKKDRCCIEKVYENGWVRVRYPIREGSKTAYVPASVFFDEGLFSTPLTIQSRKAIAVYSRKNLSNRFSTLRPGGFGYVLAFNQESAAAQILVMEDGTWEMGWISMDTLSRHCTTVSPDEDSEHASASLSVEDLSVQAGDSFDLPVFLRGETPAAMRLCVEWDSTVFDFYGAENAGLMEEMTASSPDQYPYYMVFETPAHADDEEQLLCILHFACVSYAYDQDSVIRIRLSSGDAVGSDWQPISVRGADCAISVSSPYEE